MDFKTWFYQSEKAEPEKMVRTFDNIMDYHLGKMEDLLKVAYEAGFEEGKKETNNEA
jgi:hypothetical protein